MRSCTAIPSWQKQDAWLTWGSQVCNTKSSILLTRILALMENNETSWWYKLEFDYTLLPCRMRWSRKTWRSKLLRSKASSVFMIQLKIEFRWHLIAGRLHWSDLNFPPACSWNRTRQVIQFQQNCFLNRVEKICFISYWDIFQYLIPCYGR